MIKKGTPMMTCDFLLLGQELMQNFEMEVRLEDMVSPYLIWLAHAMEASWSQKPRFIFCYPFASPT